MFCPQTRYLLWTWRRNIAALSTLGVPFVDGGCQMGTRGARIVPGACLVGVHGVWWAPLVPVLCPTHANQVRKVPSGGGMVPRHVPSGAQGPGAGHGGLLLSTNKVSFVDAEGKCCRLSTLGVPFVDGGRQMGTRGARIVPGACLVGVHGVWWAHLVPVLCPAHAKQVRMVPSWGAWCSGMVPGACPEVGNVDKNGW